LIFSHLHSGNRAPAGQASAGASSFSRTLPLTISRRTSTDSR
jgi:hypothetical protein